MKYQTVIFFRELYGFPLECVIEISFNGSSHHVHYQHINVRTAGAQAFLMDNK
jgi:hypothetical protein